MGDFIAVIGFAKVAQIVQTTKLFYIFLEQHIKIACNMLTRYWDVVAYWAISEIAKPPPGASFSFSVSPCLTIFFVMV